MEPGKRSISKNIKKQSGIQVRVSPKNKRYLEMMVKTANKKDVTRRHIIDDAVSELIKFYKAGV